MEKNKLIEYRLSNIELRLKNIEESHQQLHAHILNFFVKKAVNEEKIEEPVSTSKTKPVKEEEKLIGDKNALSFFRRTTV